MNGKGFSHHVSRSQIDALIFSECQGCQETVVRGTVKATQRTQAFDPKPTGGTDQDPVYSIHVCRKRA